MIDIVKLLLLVSLISMSHDIVAQQDSAQGDWEEISSAEALPEILKLPAYRDWKTEDGRHKSTPQIVSNICGSLIGHAETHEELETRVVNMILEGHSISTHGVSVSKKRYIVASFINQNYENLICPMLPPSYPAQHLFQRIIEMQIFTPMFTQSLFDLRKRYAIDVNSVITDPITDEKLTLLDVIDNILNKEEGLEEDDKEYNVKQLRFLKKVLVRKYGAVSISSVQAKVN